MSDAIEAPTTSPPAMPEAPVKSADGARASLLGALGALQDAQALADGASGDHEPGDAAA